MTALGLLVTATLALLVLSLPRQAAGVAVIAAVCYITQGQVLNIGFHFTAMRLVLLAGLVRAIATGELRRLRFNSIDRIGIVYASVLVIVPTLRVGTTDELIYRLGCYYDALLSYFVFRCLVRQEDDCRELLAKLAFVIVPLALLMVVETFTRRNFFSVFGSVDEFSWIRDGHVRAEGAFRNPITAGSFGATFAMLYASMLFAKKRMLPTLVGLVASILIVTCARSSGPFLGLLLGLLALAFWPLRRHTRALRWGIVISLVGLQLVMRAPVWFLIGRASDIFGGGGYHRAYLIDQAVNRFGSWWLAGINDTHEWFPYSLADGQADITNMFVAAGVDAGLLGVIVCILVVVRCFQRIGLGLKRNRRIELANEKFLWGISATLVGSIGILFSVTYFDQMQVIWYFLLACIAGIDISKRGDAALSPPRQKVRPALVPTLSV